MPSRKSLALAGGAVTIVLIVTALVAGSATHHRTTTDRAAAAHPTTTARADRTHRDAGPPVPAALTKAGLSLRAAPVAVPLELELPSLDVSADVVGVGMNRKNAMDAPEGRAGNPVWQQAFWYRGSAIPGARSTALIAGHIDGPGGTSAVFGQIDRLRPGDPIIVHDTRTGLEVHFAVTGSKSYTLAEATDPAVLTKMYGAGPVAGKWPEPSKDGLAHLTLVTCSGTFRNGTHDHRLAVFATRTA